MYKFKKYMYWYFTSWKINKNNKMVRKTKIRMKREFFDCMHQNLVRTDKEQEARDALKEQAEDENCFRK